MTIWHLNKWSSYDFLLLYWEYYIYWYEFILHYITNELFRSNQQAIVVNQQLDIKINVSRKSWNERKNQVDEISSAHPVR